MTKNDFLLSLGEKLSGLPQSDIDDRLNFYKEMIDDRIEDGFSEEEAVAQIGSVDQIVEQILAETSFTKIVREKIKCKRTLKAWEIALLIIGSPLWLSLLIVLFAIFFSLYIVLWSLLITLWAVLVSFYATAFAVRVCGIVTIVTGSALSGIAMLGVGCVCEGLGIYLSFGCKWATKGLLLCTKKIILWLKKQFVKKEKA